jgi:hypothetical protein
VYVFCWLVKLTLGTSPKIVFRSASFTCTIASSWSGTPSSTAWTAGKDRES